MPNFPLRLFLADDHAFIRDGIKLLLSEYSNFKVVGEAASYTETLEKLVDLSVDYLILDYQMPGGEGMSGILEVRKQFPQAKIILLTGVGSGSMLDAVLDAGIQGLILKEGAGDELLTAIDTIEAGKSYVSEGARNRLDANPETNLTKRERLVISMIASGLSNTAIAEQLSLSPKTVDNHRTNLMQKLDLHNTAEVVAYAIREGYK